MILTPSRLLALAILCNDDYAPAPDGQIIDAGNDIRAVLTPMDQYLIVSVRGTVPADLDNWITDFDAIPVYDNDIGWVPRGFYRATMALIPAIGPRIGGRKVIVGGHSLGGAVGAQVAGKLAKLGQPPVAYSLFEPAHSGGDELVEALRGIEGYACRFGNDPIPLLPPVYRHPCALTAIGRDMVDPIAAHSIAGVVDWLQGAREAVAA